MPQAKESKIPTFTAGEALEQYRRVIIKSGTTTTPPEVVYADAGEVAIGYTTQAVSSGCLVSVKTLNYNGTRIAIAAGAFAVDADLYSANDGKVDDTAVGSVIAKAVQAATADGDEVEITDYAVLSTTAGTVSISDAGGFTSETTVEGALQEIYQHVLSIQQPLPIPLESLFESDGTNLVARLGIATTPAIDMANGDTDSSIEVTWAANNSDAVIFETPLPPGLDVAQDLLINIRAAMGGATDTPVISADTYFNEGDTKVEDDSAAITGTSFAEYTITVAAADIPSGAQKITCELTPGAHTTDTLIVSSIQIEWKSIILTS